MDRKKFIDIVKSVVRDAAINSTVRILKNPPGRHPNAELIEKSNWFNSLSDQDRIMVEKIVAGVAHHTVFGMLAVIDGARVIDEAQEKGDLELYYVKGDRKVRLNPPESEPLHDIFNRV